MSGLEAGAVAHPEAATSAVTVAHSEPSASAAVAVTYPEPSASTVAVTETGAVPLAGAPTAATPSRAVPHARLTVHPEGVGARSRAQPRPLVQALQPAPKGVNLSLQGRDIRPAPGAASSAITDQLMDFGDLRCKAGSATALDQDCQPYPPIPRGPWVHCQPVLPAPASWATAAKTAKLRMEATRAYGVSVVSHLLRVRESVSLSAAASALSVVRTDQARAIFHESSRLPSSGRGGDSGQAAGLALGSSLQAQGHVGAEDRRLKRHAAVARGDRLLRHDLARPSVPPSARHRPAAGAGTTLLSSGVGWQPHTNPRVLSPFCSHRSTKSDRRATTFTLGYPAAAVARQPDLRICNQSPSALEISSGARPRARRWGCPHHAALPHVHCSNHRASAHGPSPSGTWSGPDRRWLAVEAPVSGGPDTKQAQAHLPGQACPAAKWLLEGSAGSWQLGLPMVLRRVLETSHHGAGCARRVGLAPLDSCRDAQFGEALGVALGLAYLDAAGEPSAGCPPCPRTGARG